MTLNKSTLALASVVMLFFSLSVNSLAVPGQSLAASKGIPEGESLATITEVGIRVYALNQVAPMFPDASLRLGHEGVAVAAMRFAPSGAVEWIEVLEAPDPEMADALRAAVQQWTLPIKLYEGVKPPHMESKATFYFLIREGEGHVLAPADAPLASEWHPRTTILERLATPERERRPAVASAFPPGGPR
ncbi:MAG: hypothetical protein R2752_13570 [Vicinamibacterales bacterium]